MKESAVKERILDVASRLFFEQGFNLTGINQIIDEAGIARGSLYNHFKSKNELLMCYLQAAEIKWFADLDIYLAAIANPRDKILGLFDHRIALQRKSGFAGCRFVKLGAEISRDQKQVFDFTAAHKKKYKKIIKGLVERIDIADPLSHESVTETVFLFIEGATAIGSLQKDEAHLKKAKKIIALLI